MERREKRALAFLLAASLLCLALVGLAAGDPPAERAEALFRAGREEFDRAAAELLRPLADEVTVDRMGSVLALRRCGREGASDVLTGFQGAALSGWEPWDGGWLWREAGGDNRCFVRRLEPGWFCFEMRF